MDKNRSRGVTVFACIWGVGGILGIIMALGSLLSIGQSQVAKETLLQSPAVINLGITTVEAYDNYFFSQSIDVFPKSLISLIITISIFKLKEWGRGGIIVWSGYNMLSFLTTLLLGGVLMTYRGSGALLNFIYSLATIYFFTRPKVKEQFRA